MAACESERSWIDLPLLRRRRRGAGSFPGSRVVSFFGVGRVASGRLIACRVSFLQHRFLTGEFYL